MVVFRRNKKWELVGIQLLLPNWWFDYAFWRTCCSFISKKLFISQNERSKSISKKSKSKSGASSKSSGTTQSSKKRSRTKKRPKDRKRSTRASASRSRSSSRKVVIFAALQRFYFHSGPKSVPNSNACRESIIKTAGGIIRISRTERLHILTWVIIANYSNFTLKYADY